jgi:hypothetical protein
MELADVFRRYGAQYRARFAARMLPSHRRALRDIEACRTERLGGQVYFCEPCQQFVYAYHSCKNRHCPKCHGEQTRRWLEAQRARLLLNCPFYLLTFTLPQELRPVARAHSKVVYRLLMQTAAAALHKLARDPRYLGAASVGALAVLHTWTRAMLFHPHVHLLVTAGGLCADGLRWRTPQNPRFFLPVRALSKIFRGTLHHRLKKAGLFALVPAAAWNQPWVVHCQHAGSGEKVLDYLGRYVYRIAITNSRLESLRDDGTVRFRYRDNCSREIKTVTLAAEQFITRFLDHVLPEGFVKVRYSGLFSSSNRHRLHAARNLLPPQPAPFAQAPLPPPPDDPESGTSLTAPPDFARCPHCTIGHLVLLEVIPRPTRSRGRPP